MLIKYVDYLKQINNTLKRNGIDLGLNLDCDKERLSEQLRLLNMFLYLNHILIEIDSPKKIEDIVNIEEQTLEVYLYHKFLDEYDIYNKEQFEQQLIQEVDEPKEVQIMNMRELKLFTASLGLEETNNGMMDDLSVALSNLADLDEEDEKDEEDIDLSFFEDDEEQEDEDNIDIKEEDKEDEEDIDLSFFNNDLEDKKEEKDILQSNLDNEDIDLSFFDTENEIEENDEEVTTSMPDIDETLSNIDKALGDIELDITSLDNQEQDINEEVETNLSDIDMSDIEEGLDDLGTDVNLDLTDEEDDSINLEDEEELSLAEILKANGLDKIDTGPRKEDEMADKLVQGINTLFSKFM